MRELIFIGPSQSDMESFPRTVLEKMITSLQAVVQGMTPRNAKPLAGSFKGTTVMEITTRFDGDTYRTMYAAVYDDAVYVLHAFQKKSKSGITTPKKEIALVTSRLREAERLMADRAQKRNRRG
ncbi:MAG: type II toxin-antitoxin system RelE/ParE family toxin [Thermomicrobiales bacterium]